MPDDISGYAGEFLGRLGQMATEWAMEETMNQNDVTQTAVEMIQMYRMRDGLCPYNDHAEGLEKCARCHGTGCVESRPTRHGMSCQMCLCIPEHGTGWFAKKVHHLNTWRVDRILFVPTAHMGIEHYLDDFTGFRLWRPSTNTTVWVRCDPGLCMECLAANFPDGQCHCLEAIPWFERAPDERPMDPHGTFWR